MSSYSTTTSTTSLVSTHHRSTTKNYEAAFGALSSSYGFGGSVPIVPPKRSANLPAKVHQNSQSRNAVTSPSSKDYAAAFASLSSSYGFSGGVPSLPSRKQ